MRPVEVRWARLGPTDRRWFIHVPAAGVCLSAFVIVRNRRGDILLGRPRRHRAWPERGCLPYWRVRDIEERGEWILPASHLLMEEAPSTAARRIARVFGGVRSGRPRLIAIDSSRMGTGQWTGRGRSRHRVHHWAIGFVYEVRTGRGPPSAPWWSETKFVPVSKLRQARIGRGHRDLIRYALGHAEPL